MWTYISKTLYKIALLYINSIAVKQSKVKKKKRIFTIIFVQIYLLCISVFLINEKYN